MARTKWCQDPSYLQGWGRNCRNSRRPFVYLTKYTLGSLWEADYQRVLSGTGFNLRNFLWSSESNVIRYLMGIGIDALALIKKKTKNPTLKCYIPFTWEFLSTAQLLLNPSLPWTLLWSSSSNCLYWVHIQGTQHLLHSTQWCHPDPPSPSSNSKTGSEHGPFSHPVYHVNGHCANRSLKMMSLGTKPLFARVSDGWNSADGQDLTVHWCGLSCTNPELELLPPLHPVGQRRKSKDKGTWTEIEKHEGLRPFMQMAYARHLLGISYIRNDR